MPPPADPRACSTLAEAVAAWEAERVELRHDLRSRIGAIVGLAEILLEATTPPLSGEQRAQVVLILRAGQGVLTLAESRLGCRGEGP